VGGTLGGGEKKKRKGGRLVKPGDVIGMRLAGTNATVGRATRGKVTYQMENVRGDEGDKGGSRRGSPLLRCIQR